MSLYSLSVDNHTLVSPFLSLHLFTQKEDKEDLFLNCVENVKNLKENTIVLNLVQDTQQPPQGFWICCSHS